MRNVWTGFKAPHNGLSIRCSHIELELGEDAASPGLALLLAKYEVVLGIILGLQN